jgi:hypothetical protein
VQTTNRVCATVTCAVSKRCGSFALTSASAMMRTRLSSTSSGTPAKTPTSFQRHGTCTAMTAATKNAIGSIASHPRTTSTARVPRNSVVPRALASRPKRSSTTAAAEAYAPR